MDTFRSVNGSGDRRHVLTLQEAGAKLTPHKQRLEECIQHGWDAYMRDYQHKHHILDARCRAAIVFREIVHKAAEIFSGVPGVTFKPFRNSFLLYIGDDIVIRFKKLNKKGRCSSIVTRQQLLFQMQQLELPGMERGTVLQAGYVLDQLQQNLVRKLVACQLAKEVLWTLELLREVKAPIEMPERSSPPSTQPRFEPKPEALPESKKKRKSNRKGE